MAIAFPDAHVYTEPNLGTVGRSTPADGLTDMHRNPASQSQDVRVAPTKPRKNHMHFRNWAR